MTDTSLLDDEVRTFRVPALPALVALLHHADVAWVYDVAAGWVHVQATRSAMRAIGMLAGVDGCAIESRRRQRALRSPRRALGLA